MNLEAAERFFEDGGFDFVRFEQTDLHGMSRSKTVPVRHFWHFAEHGLNFFGGLLGLDLQAGVAPGTGYMDERNFQDQLVWPQLETLAPVPWMERTARVIVEPSWYDGSPAAAGPRYLLRQMLDRLDGMGYAVRSGFEYEVYLVDAETREPIFPGIEIFWTLRNNFDPLFMTELLEGMDVAGVDIITANAEYGPGQMEINYAPALGVAAADLAFTFRNGLKELAQNHGYMASFMTKPFADQSASGCHYHQSLLHKESGENALYDESAPDGLSDLARHWIGGQMAHARALTTLVAPTVNCAKRYKLFSFAPMNVTWGYEDRTTAIRIKGARRAETHVENRTPCAGSNPYLVAAGMLAAGIDGITRRIEPPAPTTQIAYLDEAAPRLPQTLDESLQAFEEDEDLQTYFGKEFVQLFLAVKRHEIGKARTALPEYDSADWPAMVTEWERQNLFEYL
ncbi:MAG: glutamine synthetase [Chloroflexi bacterium]|nr:glutamine synthetase [Chloroflexota bacterium]